MEDNFRIGKDGKLTTCAVVLINSNGDILGCHGYGKPKDYGYDFPKGCADVGEEDFEAALRELKEETGIIAFVEEMIDCGIYKHNKEKNIHLFIVRTECFPSIDKLTCSTYFELYGKKFPEIDSYKIISKENRHMFNKVLHNKFEIIDKFNECD